MEEVHEFLKWNTHHATFNQAISSLRDKRTYSDVTLVCNRKIYHVHKLVIGICSEYFSEILANTEGKNPMVILTGIQCSDLELLLDYMYIGEVNVRTDKLPSLMKAADILRVKGLIFQDEGPRICSYYSVLENQSPFLKENTTCNNRYIVSSNGNPDTPGMVSPDFCIKQEKDGELPIEKDSFENAKETKGIPSPDEVEDVTDNELNILTVSSSEKSNSTLSCIIDNHRIVGSISRETAEINSPQLERRKTCEDSSTSANTSTTIVNVTNNKLEISSRPDVSGPDSCTFSQREKEIPPYTLFVQKHGSQREKGDSYHDTMGYTYILLRDKKREHLGGTYTCYVRKKATKTHPRIACKGRVLFRNGLFKMTQPHDKCQPNHNDAEIRRMRHEMKTQALIDPNGSANKIVENYYQQNNVEGNNCPQNQDSFPNKKRMCAQIKFHRAKKRKIEAEVMNTNMAFEENHQNVLLQTTDKDETLSMTDDSYRLPEASS